MPNNLARVLAIALLIAAPSGSSGAQTVTAFKTGEQVTGMTKQCFYDALGNAYTLTLRSIDLCPLSTQVRPPTSQPSARSGSVRAPDAPQISPVTVTAFKTGERTTGMTKQCFYDALGSTYAKTIGSVDLCPLTVQVRTSPH